MTLMRAVLWNGEGRSEIKGGGGHRSQRLSVELVCFALGA